MSLDRLQADVDDAYGDLSDAPAVDVDRETKHELAMLAAVFETDDVDELFRRGVHLLFERTVETGALDFHLRQGYDVTYDEFLSGMTYDEMTGADQYPQLDDDRRYRM